MKIRRKKERTGKEREKVGKKRWRGRRKRGRGGGIWTRANKRRTGEQEEGEE